MSTSGAHDHAMVINGRLALDEYVEVMRATTSALRGAALAIGAIAAAGSVMLGTTLVVESAEGNWSAFGVVLPLVLVWTFVATVLYLLPRQWTRSYKQQEMIRAPFHITVESDGVRMANELSDSLFPWGHIKHVRRSDRFTVLFISAQSVIPIPMRDLTQGQAANLDTVLDHHGIVEPPPALWRRYRVPLALLGLLGVVLHVSGTILDRTG